jgi:hypothetical protein
MRPDPGGASDDHKLNGFGCFGPGDKVSDWISRSASGRSYRHFRMGFDYSLLVSSPRWHCVIIP